jgi:hypothetical protein
LIKADIEDYKISREEVFGPCFSFMLLSIYRQTDAILFAFLAHAMQCINAINSKRDLIDHRRHHHRNHQSRRALLLDLVRGNDAVNQVKEEEKRKEDKFWRGFLEEDLPGVGTVKPLGLVSSRDAYTRDTLRQ